MKKYFPYLVYLILFLLPWQTRYIYDQALIVGTPFEYGTMSVYVVELLIAVTFLLGQRLQVRRSNQRPIKAIGIALVACAVSMVFSVDRTLSFAAWSYLLFAGMLFVILLDQRVDRWQALEAFCFGLVAPAILGLIQVISGSTPASKWLGLSVHQAADLGQAVVSVGGERLLRAYGSFTHPNVFGGFLVVGLVVLICLIVHRKSEFPIPKHHYQLPILNLQFLLVPLFSLTLIATFSRSAWLAYIFAIIVGLFFLLRKHRSKLRPMVPLASLIAISFLISGLIFWRPLTSRFNTSDHLEQISVDDRLGQYAVYPEVIKKDFLIGLGDGAYTVALSEVQPNQPSWSYQPIHNTPLLILGEVGLVGLLAILYWAICVDQMNYAAIRKGSLGAVGGIMLGSVPLVVIFFDHYVWSNWAGLALLSFLMAMTLRLSED